MRAEPRRAGRRVGAVPALLAVALTACVVERELEPEPPDPLGGAALLEALVVGYDPAARPDVSAPPASAWRDLARVHDADGDGVVTAAELGGRDLLRHDRDRDGVVTLADFPVEAGVVSAPADLALTRAIARGVLRAALADPADPTRPVAETWPARFSTLDLDRDRRLSRAEFEAAAPRPAAGRDPFGAVLELADRDGDDHLDWLELAG